MQIFDTLSFRRGRYIPFYHNWPVLELLWRIGDHIAVVDLMTGRILIHFFNPSSSSHSSSAAIFPPSLADGPRMSAAHSGRWSRIRRRCSDELIRRRWTATTADDQQRKKRMDGEWPFDLPLWFRFSSAVYSFSSSSHNNVGLALLKRITLNSFSCALCF